MTQTEKKMTKKELMYQQIKQHGENLNAIFNTGIEPITLCKKLLRLENKAHQLATDYCNGVIDMANFDNESDLLLQKLRPILGVKFYFVYHNRDARGYALKIDSELMTARKLKLYQDMGGFGIIAPDFNQ